MKMTQGIKNRFIVIFAVILIGFAIIGYAYQSVLTINTESDKTKAFIFTTSQLIHQIELNIRRAREAEKNYLAEKNEKYARDHADIMSRTRALIHELTVMVKQNHATIITSNQPSPDIQKDMVAPAIAPAK